MAVIRCEQEIWSLISTNITAWYDLRKGGLFKKTTNKPVESKIE